MRGSILEIGPRDGYHSEILAARFDTVVGVDLSPPKMSLPGVTFTKASVTDLPFRGNTFDCVLCAEVLEHVPHVEKAAEEIERVANDVVIVGVPFQQDTRVGKLTCTRCGKINPPYGHVNTFDERRLRELFHGLELLELSFVGRIKRRTNLFSSWLMTRAGNPWAAYDQEEPCVFCGSPFERPLPQTIYSRVYSGLAYRLDRLQSFFVQPAPAWIHAVFRKTP